MTPNGSRAKSRLVATNNTGSAQGGSKTEINRVCDSLNSQDKLLGKVERVLKDVNASQRKFQREFKGLDIRDPTTASKLELACTKLDDMDRAVKKLTTKICAMTLALKEDA
jgi:DNA repair ATPase RecN